MALRRAIRDNMATIVAGVFVCLVLLAALMLPRCGRKEGPSLVVRVHDSDGNAHELPLSQDETLVVATSLGRNVIVVEGGSARMLEADCPNGDCLRQLPISQPGQQLICLPHQLWVEVVGEGAPSGELDPSAVGVGADAQPGVDLVSR